MKTEQETLKFLEELKRAEKLTEVNNYNTGIVFISTIPEGEEYKGFREGTELVLIQERDDQSNSKGNLIQFPGGWCKKGETPVKTVQREMRDEISRVLQGKAAQIFFPNPEDHLFFNEKYGNWFRIDLLKARISLEDAIDISKMEPNKEGDMKLKEGAKMGLIPYAPESLLENWASYDATQAKMITLEQKRLGYRSVSFPEAEILRGTKRLRTTV